MEITSLTIKVKARGGYEVRVTSEGKVALKVSVNTQSQAITLARQLLRSS